MFDNYWLNLPRGAPGKHFLSERKEAYDDVEDSRRMVMLIRGESPASFAGSFQRSQKIHLVSLGSIVMVECALHLQQSIAMKAGPQPGRTQLHPVSANALTSTAELAHRLYALSLAPICMSIVVAEGEFEWMGGLAGIDAIVQMLIAWTRMILAGGSSPRYRPQVVIFRRRLARLPGDLESRMAGEVLATCNAARELTMKRAEGMWKQCFSGIVAMKSELLSVVTATCSGSARV